MAALKAGPPSPVDVRPPLPAMVLMMPVAAEIFRTRRLTGSRIYKFSDVSVTTPLVVTIPISVAGLPSPILPPETVVIVWAVSRCVVNNKRKVKKIREEVRQR